MQNAIYLDSTEIKSISEAVEMATKNIIGVYQKNRENAYHPDINSPDQLITALQQLLQSMRHYEKKQANRPASRDVVQLDTQIPIGYSPGDQKVTEIGNHGLQLLENLREWADVLELDSEQHQIRAIMIIIALWIARHGGELTSLDSIVSTLSEIANATDEHEMLVELNYLMGELINAVAVDVKFDFKNNYPGSPWRVLNLNRGIIATRTRDADVIVNAFEELLRNIPEDAQMFFEQGMQQMDELDYPEHVRAIVNRYYQQYKQRVLH